MTYYTPKGYSNPKVFTKHSGHERLNKPIKPTTVGKWREKLTAKQIDIFDRIAGKELVARPIVCDFSS